MKNLAFVLYLSSAILVANCFPDLFSDLTRFTQTEIDLWKSLIPNVKAFPDALKVLSLGGCPQPENPPSDFDFRDLLGLWYETERTALFELLETGQKCPQITFSNDENNDLKVNMTVISSLLNTPVTSIKSAKINSNQPNVFSMRYSLLASDIQYWVVDTDYDNYALIFACKQSLFLSIRNAWILGRKATLDASIRDNLVSKLSKLGVPETSLIKSDQSCSTFVPIQ
ncbi:apolipoprotein D [Tetranychus urticae]|uniref:Lipocalin/cytosolic fatty-acid binding domain-containing protein n=1 Tax=Tetranychus urticae TaxID=32264 RepID=T1KWB3_TETUR|nr:apolipoprotein D [Tetranychus urticae]